MRVFIDNREIQPTEFGYRSFGFGFNKLENYIKLSPYRMEFLREDFNKAFKDRYQQLVNELKDDDRIMEVDFDPPFKGATHYPTLEELHTLSSEQLLEWLGYIMVDIYEWCFPWNYKTPCVINYVAVNLEKIEVIGDNFVLSGQADHRYLFSPRTPQ